MKARRRRRSAFIVSADRQTFLGFEMTANLRDTSPLSGKDLHLWEDNVV